jgi:hypothetical protein
MHKEYTRRTTLGDLKKTNNQMVIPTQAQTQHMQTLIMEGLKSIRSISRADFKVMSLSKGGRILFKCSFAKNQNILMLMEMLIPDIHYPSFVPGKYDLVIFDIRMIGIIGFVSYRKMKPVDKNVDICLLLLLMILMSIDFASGYC